MVENTWTTEVPTEEGDYYFYGDLCFKKGDPNFRAELNVLHIKKSSNSLIYICAGQFFFPSESEFEGKFKKVQLDLPEL